MKIMDDYKERMFSYIKSLETDFNKSKINPAIDFTIDEVKFILSNIKNCCIVYVDVKMYNIFNSLFFDNKSFKITKNSNDKPTIYILSDDGKADNNHDEYPRGSYYIGGKAIWKSGDNRGKVNDYVLNNIIQKFEYLNLKLNQQDLTKIKLFTKEIKI